jgi:hypothetical protein
MAKNPKQPIQTKKHLARLERERQQRRLIIIGTVVVLVLVIAVIVFGVLNETVLKANQPVARVDGESIVTRAFESRVRYNRQQLISSAANTYQIAQLFGDSPQSQMNFVSQLAQIQAQMEPGAIGRSTLDQMVDEILIRKEAAKRGISISEAELQTEVESAFGFFPDGTPTSTATVPPQPTSTLSPLQQTLLPPTPTGTATTIPTATATPTQTATATVVPSVTPTRAPTLTPTAFTQQLFDEQYKETVNNFKDGINFTEKDLRSLVEASLLRRKVQDAVLAELGVAPEQEQIWARHILVPDQALAQTIIERLNAGDDFFSLAAEFSTDTSNKDLGGDLGWFGKGIMVQEFEDAAFALQVGELSQPVETSFGWHVIQLLGRENRPLTDDEYQSLRDEKFSEWLQQQRDSAQIEESETWGDKVPTEPAFPAELAAFIQQVQNAAIQTPAPTPAQ